MEGPAPSGPEIWSHGNARAAALQINAERSPYAAGAAIAPRSTQCHCVVLLLDDGPEKWTRAPESHRVNAVLQAAGSTTLPCARFREWGGQWDLHPTRQLSQSWMLLVTSWPPFEKRSGYGCRPRLFSFTRRVHELLCQAGESGGNRRSCSPIREADRSVFETVPARSSGSVSIGEWRKPVDMLHIPQSRDHPVSNRRRHARPL